MGPSRGRRVSRGASILAALVVVGFVGAAIFTVQTLSSPLQTVSIDRVSQTAATVAPQKCEQTAVQAACNPGEVHTIDMTKGASQCTQEKGLKCLVKNAQGVMVAGPDASNPACAKKSATSCVVRYCPPPDVAPLIGYKTGDCIVIQCKQGASANECLKNNTNLAVNASTLGGYSTFANNLAGQMTAGQADIVSIPPYASAGTQALNNAYLENQQTAVQTASGEIERKANEQCGSVFETGCVVNVENQLAKQAGLECINANSETVGECSVASGDALRQLESKNQELTQQIDILRQSGTGGLTPGGSPPNTLPGDTKPSFTCDESACWDNATLQRVDGSGKPLTTFPRPPTIPIPPTIPKPPTLPGNNSIFSRLFGNSGLGTGAGVQSPFFQLGQMLGRLISGNSGAACATNQDQYYQQVQQYNQQLQQYQFQQQSSYNYLGGTSYQVIGSNPPVVVPVSSPGYQSQLPPPPPPSQPCYNNQQPTQCMNSPQQPSGSNCTSGTWKPTTSGNGCVSGWQCIPNPSNPTNPSEGQKPVAQLSCEPKVADVGMTVAISYGCQNATASVGSGFDTSGALSGSATTTVQSPPGNANTATYSLTCTNLGVTSGAQCSVQVNRPSIVLIANPKNVQSGKASSIGWVTSGMQSCVVSSPQLPGFTAENASNTSVNGVATTPVLTSSADILLLCTTLGGISRSATTTISVL